MQSPTVQFKTLLVSWLLVFKREPKLFQLFYLNLQAVLAELFIYVQDHAISYKVKIQMGRGKEKEASWWEEKWTP